MTDLNPIAIILATSGSKGNRILFRYPPETVKKNAVASKSNALTNPYAVTIAEDFSAKVEESESNKENETLLGSHNIVGFNIQTLGTLLAAETILCGQRFDVKIKDVRFVGYPLHLHNPNSKMVQTIQSFNVVIVLRASVDTTVVNYYQDLAKQITVAIRHEECRCNYLTLQTKAMQQVHDEMTPLPEGFECPYEMILERSQLARELKCIYDSLCRNGIVHLYINHWVMVNFCLPHRVHLNSFNNKAPTPEAIHKCLHSLRPYHGVLLLVDSDTLLKSLPIDNSPALSRLIHYINPTKNLKTLSLDTDLSLSQVFRLVSHLVYWAKAMVIFPLCENNMYVLSPHTNPITNIYLLKSFERNFHNDSLPVVLAKYSLPIRMSEYRDALDTSQKQSQKCKLVVWMLQHQVLIQLHTYIFLSLPTQKSKKKKLSDSLLSSTPLSQCLLGRSVPDVTIDENCVLERTQSSSDIASVNSDESVNLGIPHSTSFDVLNLSEGLRDTMLKYLTPEEYETVLRLPASRNSEDLKLFASLCCYFDGRHHLEEIMYYENLRRSQVIAILDNFHDILETCTHEDPATSFHIRSKVMERNEEKDQVEDRVLEPRRGKRQGNAVSYTPKKKHKVVDKPFLESVECFVKENRPRSLTSLNKFGPDFTAELITSTKDIRSMVCGICILLHSPRSLITMQHDMFMMKFGLYRENIQLLLGKAPRSIFLFTKLSTNSRNGLSTTLCFFLGV